MTNPRAFIMIVSQSYYRFGLAFLLSILCAFGSVQAKAERIKDIASVAGIRSNQLLGYGLVVGLDGTGDKTNQAPFATQSFISMLKQYGIALPAGSRMQLKNIAAVMVTATLPAFAKPGQTIDITVNSIANAKSLRGGSLLMTELKGADGNVYALGQGNLVVGGLGVGGLDGSKITINVPSVGRIPGGASVEREVPNNFSAGQSIVFNLNRNDFTTAMRMAAKINETLGPDVARAIDSTSVRVDAPVNVAQKVNYLALLENLEVEPGDEAARVVINSRTGTIVVGQHVRVSPVAITHGSLTVTISESVNISQPSAFSGAGATAVVPESNISVEQTPLTNRPMFKFAPGPSLDEIVRAVNEVGAAPGDLMAILEALKQAGALKADIMVI